MPMDERFEQAIETALQPGRFVSYRAAPPFIEDLERIAARIASVAPKRAAALYETFIAGCHEKAEELDDSGGGFGSFVASLFCAWVKARAAAGADPDDTGRRLLAWMEDDPYGFCHRLEDELVKALDEPGLAAFERLVRARFAGQEKQPADDAAFARRRWGRSSRHGATSGRMCSSARRRS
jgi:hypothetical protein